MIEQQETISQNHIEKSGRMIFIITGCILILLTRLPQFFGAMLFPDGDECIVGLMAKHIIEGKDFPLFFYGHPQPYTLSIFETLPAALFYKLFGLSAISLKAAVLCLWTTGWIFFVFFLWQACGRRIAVIGGLLLIFAPGWGTASLKAWGTHVTAFTFMNLSLWLMASIYYAREDCMKTSLFTGCCLAVMALANPIWIFAVAPFAALLLYRKIKLSDIILIGTGALCTVLVILTIQRMNEGFSNYWIPLFFTERNYWKAISLIPSRIWIALTGTYFLTTALTAGPATIFATGLWMGSFLYCFCMTAINLVKRKELDFATSGCIGTILMMLAFSLFFNRRLFGYRYFLPLIGAFAVLIAAGIAKLWDKGPMAKVSAQILVAIFLLAGTISLFELRNIPSSGLPPLPRTGESRAITDLCNRLLSQNIRHVYSVDGMLQWQIMFASKEEITARWFDPFDRRPEYPRAVDRALFAGKRVALVSRAQQLNFLTSFFTDRETMFSHLEDIDGWYVIVYNPNEILLKKMGFIFNQHFF
jgi:hypothetical protein